jgi:hypothetical protein
MSILGRKLGINAITKHPPMVECAIEGPIEYGAFANPYFQSVMAKFGRKAFARSSVCCEMEAFLRRIGVTGKRALEIGTFQGMSAVLLSQFFYHVTCVSIEDDPRTIIKRDIVKHLGIAEKFTFYDVANNDEKAKRINALGFDFAYVDGDHAHDTLADFDLVKRCGRVLFHEYWPLQPQVWNLVNSLPQAEITRAQFDCFAYWERSDG